LWSHASQGDAAAIAVLAACEEAAAPGVVAVRRQEKKTKRKASRAATMREKLYHNCRMLAPCACTAFAPSICVTDGWRRDGTLLCACHRRKIEWYVQRGIAGAWLSLSCAVC
jgi:hypothetical protein